MTKKTNSLIIRYGISTLWKNKNSLSKVFSNILQLEKLIFTWLKKKTLNLLYIKYKSSYIYLFVYNQLYLNDRLKADILKYYKKTFDLSSLISKFGIEKKQLLFILSINNTKRIKQHLHFTLKKKNHFLLLSLEVKKYLTLLFFIRIKFWSVLKFSLAFFLIDGVSLFANQLFSLKRKLILYTSVSLCLRKINGFFKIKIVSKSLEVLILKLKAQPIAIKLNNIFFNRGINRVPFFGKQIVKPDFRFKFFTVFLAIAYTQSKLLAEYVAALIKKGKQHRKTLQWFTNFFEKIFYSRLLTLLGFQLRVTGKLGGKLRKSKYHYKLGKVKLQTFKYYLSYCCLVSYTKFGIISIKLWLLQLNERNRVQKIA